MARKNFKPEEIITLLRTVEIERAKGASLESAARKVGVTMHTLIRRKKEFGGLEVNQL